MKKIVSVVLILIIAMTCLASCAKPLTGNAKIVDEAKNMTHEELVAAAAKETGKFVAYATSSRIKDAAKNFGELYKLEVEGTNLKDGEIYTKLEAEKAGATKGADVVMLQDGAKLVTQRDGLLINYVPASVKKDVDASYTQPLVHQYTNKLFMWNNVGEAVPAFSNVWELTDVKYKNNIMFKSPDLEEVNKNFLIMLTNPAWSAKLATAYKAQFGKDIVLDKDCPNAGYQWVKMFLPNCNFSITSDTTIAKDLSNAQAAGKVGLFVYSKLRSSSVTKENLTVAAYDAASKTPATTINPFAGFMYPLYAMITENTTRPYTAMLFVEYLMTAEGFAPWGKEIGAYSTNSKIPLSDETLDRPLTYWKDRLVMEDPTYINANVGKVSDFITKLLG